MYDKQDQLPIGVLWTRRFYSGVINHSLYINKSLFLTMYDFRQCFEKVWLEDSLLSLWKLGMTDEMPKLISQMNIKSEAVVKTPEGETDSFQLGPNAKQGTVLGPVISSASIAECCDEQKDGGGIIGTSQVRSLSYHISYHISYCRIKS